MNRPNDRRQELLDDLLPSEETTGRLAMHHVFGLVEKERLKQRNRLAFAGIGLVALTIVVMAVRSLDPGADRVRKIATAPTSVIPVSHAPSIKNVDDEGLLHMIDEAPSALAEWPDGRQSLLILVTHSGTPEEDDLNADVRPHP